jgi:uncharacterized protein YlxW (UPF0749 family)
MWRRPVRDIHEVLRKKQAQQAQLGKQIEALQAAAADLQAVADLLEEDEEDSVPGRRR